MNATQMSPEQSEMPATVETRVADPNDNIRRYDGHLHGLIKDAEKEPYYNTLWNIAIDAMLDRPRELRQNVVSHFMEVTSRTNQIEFFSRLAQVTMPILCSAAGNAVKNDGSFDQSEMRLLHFIVDGIEAVGSANMRFSVKEIFNLKHVPGTIRKRLEKLGLREELYTASPQSRKSKYDPARRARQLANSLAGRPQMTKKKP